jgi:histidinol phosphatase-like enzyme (inositol monophosphatase family)
MSSNSELHARWRLAQDIALEAGRITLEHFQQEGLQVERKDDRSPVTIADRAAEQHLRRRIGQAFPDDAILGEEFGETSGASSWRWILDPIDGTKSFICGVPLYGTLIGIEHDNQSVVGVIHIPALGETVHAAGGEGAWYVKDGCTPIAARVSPRDRLEECVFLTSQVDGFAGRGAAAAFEELQRVAYITRTWGDCYGYLLVATGRADVMIDAEMSLWDIAALAPIVHEAGGRLTDWSGQMTIYSGEAVATNGAVHEQVLAVTRSFPRPR